MWTGVHPFITPDSLSLASVSPCLLPTLSSRLLQLIPPSFFIHPTLMLLAVPAIVPLVQSGRAKRSSSSLPTASPPFGPDWCREPPGSESSPTALLWLFLNGMRQKMIVHVVEVVSRFKVVSSVFSWWWKEEEKKRTTRKHEVWSPDPCSSTSSLVFSLCFSSPFLFYLGPFHFFSCCLVWRSKKTKTLSFHLFLFIFMFSVIFHTSVRCRKPSSADWSESGRLCHQAGLIFTSIRWVKTLPTQLRISDYQPSKMISWTEVILRSSSSISPLGLPAFYFRSLSSVWDRANVISLVPLPHPSCHFILDYISLSAFYTFFFTNAVYFLSTIICSNSEDFMKPTFLIMSPKLCSKQFFLLGSLWCQWQRTEAPPACWRRSYSSLLQREDELRIIFTLNHWKLPWQ